MSAFAALAGMAMFLQSSTNSLNMNATTDTFSTGLASMATYLGDTILPISAGLGIAFGLYEYSQRGNGEKYITGALAMTLGSMLLTALLTLPFLRAPSVDGAEAVAAS